MFRLVWILLSTIVGVYLVCLLKCLYSSNKWSKLSPNRCSFFRLSLCFYCLCFSGVCIFNICSTIFKSINIFADVEGFAPTSIRLTTEAYSHSIKRENNWSMTIISLKITFDGRNDKKVKKKHLKENRKERYNIMKLVVWTWFFLVWW